MCLTNQVVSEVVSPCFCPKVAHFPNWLGCSMIFDCPVDRSWCAQRCCDGAATESLLRRSRCCDGDAQTSSVALILRVASATQLMLLRRSCDGVAAATEMCRPAPSRSFCASRLDATR